MNDTQTTTITLTTEQQSALREYRDAERDKKLAEANLEIANRDNSSAFSRMSAAVSALGSLGIFVNHLGEVMVKLP